MDLSEKMDKALALHRSGQLQEAARLYKEIVQIDPSNVEALNFLGIIFVGAGKFVEGETLARQAIAISPNYVGPFVTLGSALHGAGRLEEAVDTFLSALEMEKREPAIYNNLASVLNDLGQFDEAVQYCLSGLALNAKMPALFNNLGNAMEGNGELKAAEANYRKALSLEPEFPDALYNLGTLLSNEENWHEAIDLLEKAILIDPDHAEKHYNLANTFREIGRFHDAQRYYENAIQLHPDNEDFINNFAILLQMRGRLDEAKTLLYSAIKNNPDNPDLHWNLALVLIENGEFEEGWREYEWRWKSSSFSSWLPSTTAPRWAGENISGKRLMIFCEQGFGDNIEFVRYLAVIAKKGADITIVCRPELTRLFAQLPMIKSAVNWDEVPREYDYYVPLLSLPHILNTTIDSIPNEVPYLVPTENDEITDILARQTGLKVGLAWAGSSSRRLDQFRSIRAAYFDPLMTIERISFFSLQVGDRIGDLETAAHPNRIVDLGSKFSDFADTAAAISKLDLVISVDTAVAHLTGALGVPVWIILFEPAGYLWMQEQFKSPWYPTAKLYRQLIKDSSDEVIDQIARDLAFLADESR